MAVTWAPPENTCRPSPGTTSPTPESVSTAPAVGGGGWAAGGSASQAQGTRRSETEEDRGGGGVSIQRVTRWTSWTRGPSVDGGMGSPPRLAAFSGWGSTCHCECRQRVRVIWAFSGQVSVYKPCACVCSRSHPHLGEDMCKSVWQLACVYDQSEEMCDSTCARFYTQGECVCPRMSVWLTGRTWVRGQGMSCVCVCTAGRRRVCAVALGAEGSEGAIPRCAGIKGPDTSRALRAEGAPPPLSLPRSLSSSQAAQLTGVNRPVQPQPGRA